MKLKFTEAEIERSSSFEATQFDIGDKRIIMEILRGKMYSNPIQTICQEISCNARDAHKEVGKVDIPIEIKLPNKLEPFFYIKDFGPGISPDRVSNVYVLYGVSTKRHANDEDGGFGLGSKSPFSYTDTFSVIVVTTENGKRIRREYLAHIDESGLGQMSLVNEGETEDPQGTTVQFYVEEKDFASFSTHVKRACAHWEVPPVIKGDPDFEWPEIKEAYSGEGWAVHEVSPLDQKLYALVNGIPYNLNLRHIFSNEIPELYQNLDKIPLRLHFGIGEIPVTANREEIDYQDEAIARLRKRVEEAVKGLQGKLIQKLAKCKSLRSAVIFWLELRKSTYGCLLSLSKWRDFKLSEYQNIHISGTSGIRATHYRLSNDGRYGHKKSSNGSSIPLVATTLLVEDDIKTKGVSRARLATLFQERGATKVTLVDFLKKEIVTKTDAGTHIEVGYATEEEIKDRKKSVHWDLLDPIKLSSIPKRVLAPSTRVRHKTIKLKVFSRDDKLWEPIPDDFNYPPIKFYVETASKSVILRRLSKKGVSQIIEGTITRPLSDISHILSQIEGMINIGKADSDKIVIQLFGAVPSEVPKLDKTWYPLNTYASQVLESFKASIPSPCGGRENGASVKFNNAFYKIISKPEFMARLTSNCLLHGYLKKSEEADRAYRLVSTYNNIAAKFGFTLLPTRNSVGKDFLEKDYENIVTRYPLIKCFGNYYYPPSEAIDDMIEYVNLKDQKFAAKQLEEKSNETV